jgi:hypothetical protein
MVLWEEPEVVEPPPITRGCKVQFQPRTDVVGVQDAIAEECARG